MIEDHLEKFRKEYLKIGPSVHLEHHGWQDLYAKLERRQDLGLNLLFGRGLAFASITLLLFASVVGVAQAAKPGDVLYPVKLFSDQIVAQVSGKPEIKVERRGQEVIDLSNHSQEQLDEAAHQYQKSLNEAKNEAEKSGKKEEFNKALETQEQKFKNALENNPRSANGLQRAIEETQKVKGQVQGQKDQEPPVQSNQNNNNGNGQGQDHP